MTASVKSIDFKNVKDGGQFNRNRIPAGDYLAKIIKVEDAQAKDETFQYLFTIQIVKRPSSKHPYYCKLQDNQLWKIRNLFIAAGKSVPKSKVKIDPNTLVNKLIGVTIDDTEYDEKEQSEITAVFPAAELGDNDGPDGEDESEDEEEEDEDDAPLEDDEDEEEEDEADDGFGDLDRAGLKREIVKINPDFQAKKSQSDEDLLVLLRGLVAAADTDEEEEEDEAPAPKKKAKPAAKAAPVKKLTKKKASADDSDEDLEDLDLDDL